MTQLIGSYQVDQNMTVNLPVLNKTIAIVICDRQEEITQEDDSIVDVERRGYYYIY